ncbi:MAG: hypothetical protein J0L70_23110 [Leptolyngbya sp. UWPOB_LEPTO1]|uniref:hypothetical protein n=1 Tax=Leptolyngbya sp. UWPOB_LEPTO1 TaxID=2815653 RepID=UPI001AC6AE2E|nr:hypothetical protein [Leptolyngbya sp. UWPOB_LEPTO1]MBN8563430.1 hypothetical protein [Leptolyngbya sp. UWPOB_LEPTO1]
MKIASFKIPEFSHFDPIGVMFKSKTKAGNDRVFFWVAPYQEKPERLYRWIPMYGQSIRTGIWKELSIESALPSKKRSQLQEFWQAQDIGLWITQSKRLAELNANLRTSA